MEGFLTKMLKLGKEIAILGIDWWMVFTLCAVGWSLMREGLGVL